MPISFRSIPSFGANGGHDSDSDSGWSDLELEDVAAIKFRARTPPWQQSEGRGPARGAAGDLGERWRLVVAGEQPTGRLQEVRTLT